MPLPGITLPRSRLVGAALLLGLGLGGVACRGGEDGEHTGRPTRPQNGPAAPSAGRAAPQAGGGDDRLDERLLAPDTLAPDEGLLDHVDALARDLAAREYTPRERLLPPALADLDYDGYRRIRFRPDSAIGQQRGPFEVQLFHLGAGFRTPVHLNLVRGSFVEPILFDPDRFTYDGPASALSDALAGGLDVEGHAGFRVHFPLNREDVADEVVAFLGSSYFRLLGPGHLYGLSARGLAVDVAEPTGEEFPDFVAFWLREPEPGSRRMSFVGLLDSPSLTGAYGFELAPGAPPDTPTTLTVEARLHARRDVRRLGVAPLTSMFLYGPDGARDFDDVRPRVHDSDGLLMWTGRDEWIWRPLSNGPGLRVTGLQDRDPKGFGLAQRARDFRQFLDLEARYHRRPSQWVEALDAWGPGAVELVEIPSASEFNDNVVAYWRPANPLRSGEHRTYRYRLVTFDDRLPAQSLAQVERSRNGWDALPGQTDPPPTTQRRFVVDFYGGPLRGDEGGSGPVEAVVETSAGRISGVRVEALPDGSGRRVTFRLSPDAGQPSDMRLHLVRGDEVVSETWSYLWIPPGGPE